MTLSVGFQAAFTHRTPFAEQVRLVSSSDVLVGLHGAGLTHLLLLPDWGAVFELYHCEDPDCYSDLARLRGLSYTTWQRPELITPQNEVPASFCRSLLFICTSFRNCILCPLAHFVLLVTPIFLGGRGFLL